VSRGELREKGTHVILPSLSSIEPDVPLSLHLVSRP
jgi:hypothetical protein